MTLAGRGCSKHEGEGGVAEAVANVEAAENGRVASMIRVVTRPKLAAEHYLATSAVFQNRPAALRLVSGQNVQKVIVVNMHLSFLE